MKTALMLYLAFFVVALPAVVSAHEHEPQSHARATPSGDSLFNSKTVWREASGREVKLAEFRGSKVILTMAYTSCTYTCPLTVAKLKEMESALVASGFTDFKIVLASFDPKRDNPARLSEYIKEKKLSSRWILLCPRSEKDVRELAALLGVTYSQDKKGDFSHSNIISFMDEQGVIRKTLNGLASDPKPLMSVLTGS